MKRRTLTLLVAATTVLLGGCGLFSAPVTDPFGLDGETLAFTVQPNASALAPQAEGTVEARAALALTLDDREMPASSTIANTVTFRGPVTVATADGVLPATLVVDSVDFSVVLSDDAASDSAAGAFDGALTLTRDPECASVSECPYTFDAPEGVRLALDLGRVLANDVAPNTLQLTASMDVTSDPPLQPGATLRVTLDAAEGSAGI